MSRRAFLKLAGLLLLSGIPPYQVWLPLVRAGASSGRWDSAEWGGFTWG